MLPVMEPTNLLVVNSTPLVAVLDLEAARGKSSRGWFKGFKLHAAVNQQGLHLRAVVTRLTATARHIFQPLSGI